MVIIGFRSSMDGFKDAVEFENSFNNVRQGRWDFERDSPNGYTGTQLYGWMATEKVRSSSDDFDLSQLEMIFMAVMGTRHFCRMSTLRKS